jgi:hypothetical protein
MCQFCSIVFQSSIHTFDRNKECGDCVTPREDVGNQVMIELIDLLTRVEVAVELPVMDFIVGSIFMPMVKLTLVAIVNMSGIVKSFALAVSTDAGLWDKRIFSTGQLSA